MLEAVESWEVSSDRDPPDVSEADILAIEAALIPARHDEIAAEVAKVMSLHPPPPNPTMHAAACLTLLRHVPMDILKAGLLRVVAECTYTPKPSEIWQRVETELGERKRLAAKARVAATMAARRRPAPETRIPLTPEQQRVLDDAMQRLPQAVRRFA